MRNIGKAVKWGLYLFPPIATLAAVATVILDLGWALIAIWTIIAAGLLMVGLIALGWALSDRDFLLRSKRNGELMELVLENIRGQFTGSVVGLALLVVGMTAIINTPWRAEVARVGLLLVVSSLLADRALALMGQRTMMTPAIGPERDPGRAPFTDPPRGGPGGG